MSRSKEQIMQALFGLDDIVEDGLYCIPPTEEDMIVFRKHAESRLSKHNQSQNTHSPVSASEALVGNQKDI